MKKSKDFYTISEFAELIEVSPQTLRNWEKSGELMPAHVDEKSNYRYYTKEQYDLWLENKGISGYRKKHLVYMSFMTDKEKVMVKDEEKKDDIDYIKAGYYIKGFGLSRYLKDTGVDEVLEHIINNDIERVIIINKGDINQLYLEIIQKVAKLCNVDYNDDRTFIKPDDIGVRPGKNSKGEQRAFIEYLLDGKD